MPRANPGYRRPSPTVKAAWEAYLDCHHMDMFSVVEQMVAAVENCIRRRRTEPKASDEVEEARLKGYELGYAAGRRSWANPRGTQDGK